VRSGEVARSKSPDRMRRHNATRATRARDCSGQARPFNPAQWPGRATAKYRGSQPNEREANRPTSGEYRDVMRGTEYLRDRLFHAPLRNRFVRGQVNEAKQRDGNRE
jgi:hypothetical protein